MTKIISIIVTIFFLIGCNNAVFTPHTQHIEIKSIHTGANYVIHIDYPPQYKKNYSYPFLFLLDDTYSFRITSAIVEHLQARGYFQPLVVVGIAYQGQETQHSYRFNRTRDYTPWPMMTPKDGYGSEYMAISGGARNFQLFFKQELFPKLQKDSKIESKTLVGHSLGGLFGVFDSLTQRLFDSYILISPSLWYNQYTVLTLWGRNHKKNLPHIFFAAGSKENKGHNTYKGTQKFYQEYKRYSPESQIFLGGGEDHETIFPTAITRGLMAIFHQG